MSDSANLPLEAPRPSARKTRLFAALALLVAAGAFALIAVFGIGENLVYYWGPTELLSAGDKAKGATIRLGGLVKEGSIVRGDGVSGVEFDVIDRKGAVVHVRSTSVPPQLFRERIGVVVEGTVTPAGQFESKRLMISHSNEYRAPGEGQEADVKTLMKSTEGLDSEVAKAK